MSLSRSCALAAAPRLKRDGNPAKASTALIITVNRQHYSAVKQAAPDPADPGQEAVGRRFGRREAALGRIQLSHEPLLLSTSAATRDS